MIYYIYKVRRKQTSIRFSRSALPHRYLRSISWKSWIRRPQAATSWVPPYVATRARVVFAAVPIHQGRGSCALAAIATQKVKKVSPNLSPRKRKLPFFPSPRAAPSALLCPQALHVCRPRSICGRSAVRPSRYFLRPSHKQKMRARSIAPRTRSKKHRLLAQENTRRHAWLTRSCFGRVVFQHRRPAFTTALFPFSFFTKEKKKENRSKFSRFEYIARTHFVRPHDVRDWPVAPRPLKFM